ncbi:MAG: DNA repair protein RecN, partial [Lachnospiraceae bacterium]|nr:DNA repair protein RecN [Lachnospiraceae bacterium]
QISEIEAANLKEGEDALLETGYKKAVNSKEILLLANEIYEATGYNSSGAGDMIGRAAGNMRRIAELDEDARAVCNTLIDVDGMLNDFNSELNRYMKSIEFDEQSFAELEERLNLINLLKSKYGRTITDILNTLKNFEEQYKKLISYDEYMHDLKDRFETITRELAKASNELTDIRKKEAEKLCKVVKKALEELNFMTVAFDMEWRKLSDYTANGNDEAYFVISTNVGEPMRPLYEVASGGELSRVMLAIKSSIANRDDTPTLIFDEIDVGISGRTAQKVAEKLSVIGRTHQVICITHLPQIAAMADSHYSIEKNVVNNKTVTNIRKLVNEEEINEIARLLGGAQITASTIASAREMKQLADKAKIN